MDHGRWWDDLMPRSAHSFFKHSVKELLLFKWHGPAHIWLPAACSWNATDALTGVLVEAGVTRLGRRGPTPRHTKANAGVAMTKTCHSRLYCVTLAEAAGWVPGCATAPQKLHAPCKAPIILLSSAAKKTRRQHHLVLLLGNQARPGGEVGVVGGAHREVSEGREA